MTALLTPGGTHAPHHNQALGLRFSRLGRSFGSPEGKRIVLQDVSLDVRAGEILAILGTSGCGKSTLLRTAAGLDAPDSGQVLIDGDPVRGIDERCAVAFQEPRLLPWHTLRANVAIGLPRSASASTGKAKVLELLELVGLDPFAALRPREVSGGMAQRASLARALARDPGVLLLDEPFGALDALTRIRMQDLLLDIHRVRPTTVLLVTHDVDEALLLADRILVLGRGSADTQEGSSILELIAVPGVRPHDRNSADLGALRSTLLSMLGVTGR
ncbi:ABC transporter ATP-binding protein [Arthrobacter echini]|uniref:ABC transporter ATP-binding protein n=1 Tax=Arthrobacter echini TaxID=1529066 RepID=UPI001FE735C5|nr:ABC transporter ATP-binding protein [Arthrobacter echini]